MNKILLEITEAQNASDLAKSYYGIDRSMVNYFYNMKDTCILNAIRLINIEHRKGNKDIRFSVQKDIDNVAYFIVYFNFKIDGERRQISFHSYNLSLEKYVNKNFQTRWNKKYSSRKTARELEENEND